MYEPRTYRHWIKGGDLISFNVVVKETDLYIRASTNLKSKARKLVLKYRDALERYIERHPAFLTSLEPLPVDDNAPHIVKAMSEAASKAEVGPMASVAGAIAEFVGTELLAFTPEIIVENGGDIYLKSLDKKIIGIYAGESPLSGKIGLEIDGADTPLGICTSSGTVGHSLSYGKADAVIVLSQSATLADATATAIANLIKQPGDIPNGIELAKSIEGVSGVIIIQGDKTGLWGKVKIC
ncbi:unnamed protein product [marine sediment metagenome]|uniref:Thiamine biosynthesis protein ApbE n=1 Tax=marine sediment metagenome TaxID=412755 RepID=X1F5S9_9ZZZZ